MAAASETYYAPYRSDSDSDTDSESDASTSYGSESDTSSYARLVTPDIPRNFRALAEGLRYDALAGPSFDAPSTLLAAQNLSLGYPILEGEENALEAVKQSYIVPPSEDAATSNFKFTTTVVNNIVMLDSADRDRGVFPQPTNVTLRLPRTYTNVTQFQLVQIKLLSAFFYFRNSKNNTDISILELNRTYENTFGVLVDAIVKSFIREGSYDIASLLNELTIQLNRTPVFYDFPNGFQDFAPQFAATGNFALGFNFPGDTFYDSLLDQYIANPTTTLIVTKYFQSQYAGQSSYSTDQIKVAYYYPVVKEQLLDQRYDQELNLEVPPDIAAALLPTETVYSRCIYTFQGLDDVVVQQVIRQNIAVLDRYRVRHTFRYSLINKYTVTYETQNNRVTFSAPSLNTSLSNLITYKQAQYFAEQLNENGITQAQYNALQTQNTLLLAVLNDMFYFIERWLAVYFGINFNSYTLNYIATPSNLVPIQNAVQATGISSNFDLAVLSQTTPPVDSNILLPLRQDPPSYWNRLTALPASTISFPWNLETGSPATSSNYPYSLVTQQQDRTRNFVDSNGYLYTNKLTKFADIVTPVDPTGYTVFRFKSPVRQTLQVETLPRPTQFRYPAYNAIAYDLSQQILFDNSYSFVQTSQNVGLDVTSNFSTTSLTPIPGFSTFSATTSNFGVSYLSSLNLWGAQDSSVFVGSTRSFFQFQTPLPTNYATNPAPGYRYPLSLTLAPTAASTFSAAMNFYLYHDRGAFMADVSDVRLEKPIHYLTSASVSSPASTATITFPVYGNQTYYVLARSVDAVPASQSFRVVPWFPSSTAYVALTSSLAGFDPFADPQSPAALSNFNYAQVADPAFLRLPIQPAIQTDPTPDALFSNILYSTAAMGYDTNGVSTDLTDYCGFVPSATASTFVPTATLRLDPITSYGFQVGSGYSLSTQTYVDPRSSNAILKPLGAGTYTPSTITARQTTMAQWYGTTYIPNSENQAPMLSSFLADTSVIQPYTSTTTNAPLTGYTYAGSNGAIQFGDGVCGISFVPQQGVWDIDRTMFKSVYTSGNSTTDGNLNIAYLGVFPSALTQTQSLGEFSLSSAIAVLKFTSSVTYTVSTVGLGFDTAGGTYYEFQRDTTFRTGSTSYLYGYTQIRSTINTDINAMYTFIPYDSGQTPLFFQGLVGTPVPYPFYSDASAGLAYSDGSTAPDGTGLVVPVTKGSPDPLRGPPAGYDETQVKYEQSMTIGTNLLHYASPFPFLATSTALKAWEPLPFSPSLVVTDVSGYFLTQDSVYRVFEYYGDNTSTLTERYQFTLDQVYPTSNTNINFIGVAANESQFAFFAYSNASPTTPTTSKLLIRTLRPSDGTLTQSYEYWNLPGLDPTSQQITNMTFNNFGGFTLGLKAGSTVSAFCKHSATTSTVTFFSTLAALGLNSNVDLLITRQSPKEAFGAFTVFPYRSGLGGPVAAGITEFIQLTPSNLIGTHNPNYVFQALTGPQDTWPISRAPTQIQVFNLSNATVPKVFKQPVVSQTPFQKFYTFLTDSDPTHLYQVTDFTASNAVTNTSNAIVTPTAFQFPAAASNLSLGAEGGKWSQFNSTLYGNRENALDAPKRVRTAWQLFYPVQRTVFKQIAKNFTFMHDLSGLQYPEYPHTTLLGYDSATAFNTDTAHRWGLESSTNFVVADFSFSGRTFNSYMFTFPLQPTTPSKPYYYLAVRNYSPTEKAQVMLRASAPNLYDFGYVSMTDLSNEVPLLSTTSNMFNPEYHAVLSQFNSNFIIDSNGRVFGSNIVQGYAGSNISSVVGFGDFYNRFTAIYAEYNAAVQLIDTINSNTNQAVVNFIQTDLQYILPATALNRQRFTDPLTFTILWKSALQNQYRTLEDNWGLGWNLGYAKEDTPYETVHRAQSFYKILDDYISLRLNPEFNLNRMDTGAKENLGLSLEPTGATKAVHAKLLLANFGNFAQTMITNPITFSPPLARLDRLTFQWVDLTGAVIDNSDCEWNTVIQVGERVDIPDILTPMRVDQAARVTRIG